VIIDMRLICENLEREIAFPQKFLVFIGFKEAEYRRLLKTFFFKFCGFDKKSV